MRSVSPVAHVNGVVADQTGSPAVPKFWMRPVDGLTDAVTDQNRFADESQARPPAMCDAPAVSPGAFTGGRPDATRSRTRFPDWLLASPRSNPATPATVEPYWT